MSEDIIDGNETSVADFTNYLYGKENDPVHGAVARYVQDHVTRRPASSADAKWTSFDHMRRVLTYYGHISIAQLDAAIAAFRAA